ncbi:hypothetical protein ACGC1H_005234 [Rhizoctonia solani]
MIYRTRALSFSLLLGAGGVAVTAAISLPCHDDQCGVYPKDVTSRLKARAMYGQESILGRNVVQMISRSILDDLTSSPDETQDNTSDFMDSEAPVGAGSPAGVDLNDPVGSITGWLSHEGRVYNTLDLEGELDLIAQSEEKPAGVKIGTLGYAPDSSAHTPFELLSETEAGSLVFLTLPQPLTDQTEKRFDDGAAPSNHSTPILMARSAPLGLDLLPNLNLTRTDAIGASGVTEPSGLVHVLIKIGSPSSPGTLCATFYARPALTHTEDDAPMFLERCDNTFIPGSPASSDGFTATQLWQYDPRTHELKPILKREPGMSDESTSPSVLNQTHSNTSDVTVGKTVMSQSFGSSAVETRTTTIQPVAAAQQTQSYTSNSSTPTSSSLATPSQANIRRVAAVKESLPPSFKVVAIVEPYTLIFAPRITSRAGNMLPDSPV